MKARVLVWVMVLVAGLVYSTKAAAAPLDARVPGDAVIYVGWQGADALAAPYQASNLKGIMDSSTLPGFVQEKLSGLMEQGAAEGAKNAQNIADGKVVLGAIWKHPTAIYCGPADFTNIEKPVFRLALLCDAGADAKAMVEAMSGLLKRDPPPEEAQMAVGQDGTVVIITLGSCKAADFSVGAAAGSPRLADSAAYKKAMGQVQADAAVTAYADVQKILGAAEEGIAAAKDAPPQLKRFPQIVAALGLDKLTQVAVTGSFDKKQWAEKAFLGVNGSRTGLLALVDTLPISEAVLGAAPKDAATVSTQRFDFSKALALVRTVLDVIDPTVRKQFEAALASGSAAIGVDIEKEIIAPLGDEWMYYRAPATDGGAMAIVVVHKLKDAETFGKTLGALEEFANAKGGPRMQISKETAGKYEVSAVRLPQFAVAWTVRGGMLYVSSLEGIASAIDQVEGKKASVAASAPYQAVMRALPAVKASQSEYADIGRLYPEMYTALMKVLPLLQASLPGFVLPEGALPEPAKIAQYLTPGGTVSWWDEAGYHAAGTSAFPGAALLSGEQSGGVAAGAMAVAILLPSLGRARELSNRAYDAASLRGIAQSCNVWAADNKDQMPDHLGRLILSNQISPKQLVSKRGTAKPLELTDKMQEDAKKDFAAFAKLVDEHCDFVYLGKGMSSDVDASVVLVFERPSAGTIDGINMAFQDAYAEFIRWPSVSATLDATNDYLEKKKLPTIDIPAIMKGAPRGARVNGPANAPGLP